MTQQNQQGVSKQNKSLKQVLSSDNVKERFQQMLGQKANSFLVSVINVVQNNDRLKDADHNSILYAAATAASLDLPVDTNLGTAYIVPYKDHKSGITYAQFQMGYKGFIQLAQRTGQFQTIGYEKVYDSDSQESVKERINSYFTKQKPEGNVIGYLGYFRLLNGFEKTLYMSIEELQEHGKKYSQTYGSKKEYVRNNSLWATNFEVMASKTVIKLLLSKYAPLTTEMQHAVKTDQAVVHDYEGNQLTYVDNQNDPEKEAIEEQENAVDLDAKEQTEQKQAK